MTTLKLGQGRAITLPQRIFKPNDAVALFAEGDTVIVKRLTPVRLSELAIRRKERALPLENIVREIQAYRRERRRARGA